MENNPALLVVSPCAVDEVQARNMVCDHSSDRSVFLQRIAASSAPGLEKGASPLQFGFGVFFFSPGAGLTDKYIDVSGRYRQAGIC